jgi:hypothetical protein
MSIYWIFFFLILLCIYVLFGLYLTDGLVDFKIIAMTWVIYTCLWITVGTVFLLAYFWGTLRTKTGPYGIRGVSGERGVQGLDGTCSVTATQSEAIKQVNELIDKFYQEKTGNSMLNQETQAFINNYLTNKISTVAGSKQYRIMYTDASALGKTPQEVINYVKGIWKEWVNIIYDANPAWYLDEYADEDYSWSSNGSENPFTEIKKYDMYYWGLSTSFRPMKAEVCRSSAGYESSKFPIKPQARLKIIQSNDYMKLTDDWHTRGNPDASWWRARTITIGDDTYYPTHDIITAGDRNTVYGNLYRSGPNITGDMQFNNGEIGPDIRSVLVAGDVVDPINMEEHWIGGGNSIITSSPICPDGYVSIGDIISYQDPYSGANNDDPNNYKIKCIPADCVEDNGRAQQAASVWNQNVAMNVLNHWNWGNPDANGDNGYNAFRVSSKPYYRIKTQCLAPPATPSTKDPEDENIAIGIGWYGHPYKSDPRYSIFTFLGLVPEGMIIHQATGRRFYIIHYGGEDVNKYVVLDYNAERDKFDSALQVDDNPSNPKVNTRDISRKDERQQWRIILQSDKKYLTLKNIMNGRYLYMGLKPETGDSQFSTIPLDNNAYHSEYPFNQLQEKNIKQSTTFSFISTFGTQMDIIDKSKSTQSASLNS